MEGRMLPTREQTLIRQDWQGLGRGLAQGDTLPDGTMPVNMDGEVQARVMRDASKLIEMGFDTPQKIAEAGAKEVFDSEQKKVPPPEGGILNTLGDYFKSEEAMTYLVMGLNSLRSKPDQQIGQMLGARAEKLGDVRRANATMQRLEQSDSPQAKRALEYLRATGDVKGAAKMAFGTDTTYGLTPQKIIDDQGNVKWVQLSSTGGVRDVELPAGYKVAPNVDKIDLGTEWLLIDQQGNPIGRQKKEIRETELETELGKYDAERVAAARKTIQQSSAGIELIDRILDPTRKNQFDSVFGFVEGRLPTLRETTTEMEQEIYQLGNMQFLAAFESLRGGGQISNIEGAKAQAAYSALFDRETGELKAGISEDFARKQLQIIKETMQKAARRAEQNLLIDPNYNPDKDSNDSAYLRKAGEFAQSNPYAGFSIAR
jgi:hypothetical protein